MERARALLAQAESGDDARPQAHAHLRTAQTARLATRFQDARHHAERAAAAFQALHDPANESLALSIQAYAASNLGRNDEAVKAALLGVRVAEQQPARSQRVLALNDLGIAYFWARSFQSAQTAFVEAIRLAHQAPQASMLQPAVNRCCAETIRLVLTRYQRGSFPSVERQSRLLELARLIVLQDALPPEQPEQLLVMAQVLWKFMASLNAAWQGDLAQARRHQACAQQQFPYGSRTWLDPLYLWAQAELQWAEGPLPQAKAIVLQMIEAASEIEYEQVAQIGMLMAVQLWDAQGQHDEAMALLRQLQQREQRVRTESLASRAQAVQWQLDAREREREREVSAWTERAQELEALSHQDALTGLANRRGFEREGSAALQNPGTVSLALVDIDRFKQVNDRHSHQVGDGVLRRIPAILSASVEPQHQVARLAGD